MNPLLRVIEALNRHDVCYVVVGGFAAVMLGHLRATRHLDIVVDLEPAQANKEIDALLSIGMASRAPLDPRRFCDPQQRRRWRTDKDAVVFTMIDPAHPVFAVDLFIEPPMGRRHASIARRHALHRSASLSSVRHRRSD